MQNPDANPLPDPTPRYWAFLAKPSLYRIEEAIAQLEVDWWPAKRSAIAIGDRVAIWHGSAGRRDRRRGIIACGEVIAGPENRSEADNPFWLVPPDDIPAPRVCVRYVRSPNLPLWLGESGDALLRSLTVSRVQSTVFHIQLAQWRDLVAAAGGWPSESSEIQDIRDLIDGIASRQRGQGFRVSVEARKLIELNAMERATRHYRNQGWTVRDVSAIASFDLFCTKGGGQGLRVEVKGTSGGGSAVLLTPNEVAHAREHFPNVALFVVSGLQVSDAPDGSLLLEGGVENVFEPWDINTGRLRSVGFVHEPA